jgi:hypothetical protein
MEAPDEGRRLKIGEVHDWISGKRDIHAECLRTERAIRLRPRSRKAIFGGGGWIEMQFTFRVQADGTVQIITSSSKKYPSVSVYSYSSTGDTKSLSQQTESGDPKEMNRPRSTVTGSQPSSRLNQGLARNVRAATRQPALTN